MDEKLILDALEGAYKVFLREFGTDDPTTGEVVSLDVIEEWRAICNAMGHLHEELELHYSADMMPINYGGK